MELIGIDEPSRERRRWEDIIEHTAKEIGVYRE